MMQIAPLLLSLLAAGPAEPGRGFEVERYAVSLRPDLATTMLSGHEEVTVRGTQAGVTRLAFSPNALRIDHARVNGVPVIAERRDDALIFPLPRLLRRGERAVVRFDMAGLPARGVVMVPGGLYTSYFACDWMVCLQDAPGDKAMLTLDLYLPHGLTSLASGRAGSVTRSQGALTRHRWRTTRAYSPYLYAFAAGRFTRSSIRTPAGTFSILDATGGGVQATLPAQTSEIAAFLSEKAGVPIAQRRYAQLLVPGGEAQETATFSLIGSEELAHERQEPASAWIVVHEMAHQWWGNLVTCATWQHFWLNEGITTFMVAAWKQHRFGDAAYQRELGIARRRLVRVRDAGYDKPLAWDGRYPSLGIRRAVQYSKGALFMDMLRRDMGETAFWQGLRRYTRRHAGGTVTSRDLEEAMQSFSARDLSPLFAEWVFGTQDDQTRTAHDRPTALLRARKASDAHSDA